ncbi:MAG: hypothetical protein IPP71_16405 [Bacteroidetes bacterium]|nr:hypothetical protein [Bacteroidota bacterium]
MILKTHFCFGIDGNSCCCSFYFKGNDVFGFLNNFQLQSWSLLNCFSRNFSTVDGISQYALPNILFIFSSFVHPGFLFPGLFFIFLIWYNKNQPSFLFKPLVFGILLYTIFLCGIPFQNTRFLVPVLPFFLIICFPSYLTILSWFHYRRKLFYLFIFIVVTIQFFLVYRALLPFYKVNMVEKEITAMVLKHEPKSIYTFGLDGALRSYGFTGELINLFDHPLDSVVNGSFLVFNKSACEKQWKGRNPMINFEFILKSEQVKLIDTFTGGWELYEIHEKYRLVNPGVSRIN